MHNRRSIRLPKYNYAQPGMYFVTIVTHERECIFGEIQNAKMILNDIGKIVLTEWYETMVVRPYVGIDEFIVMPNHVHGIIVIHDECRGVLQYTPTEKAFVSPSISLGSIIRGFKGTVTQQINTFRYTPSSPIWQRNYYEHVIRNNEDLNRIREYIKNNPKNWDADEYQ